MRVARPQRGAVRHPVLTRHQSRARQALGCRGVLKLPCFRTHTRVLVHTATIRPATTIHQIATLKLCCRTRKACLPAVATAAATASPHMGSRAVKRTLLWGVGCIT